MRYTDKSNETVYNEIKNWAKLQFPKDGKWYYEFNNLPLGSDEMFVQNIPYHATDIKWLKKYMIHNYKMAYNYTMLKQMSMEKFLESDDFLAIVQEYQNKIINWQLVKTLNEKLKTLTNKEDEIINICEETFKTLTSQLKMDEVTVKQNLEIKQIELIKQYQQTTSQQNEIDELEKRIIKQYN